MYVKKIVFYLGTDITDATGFLFWHKNVDFCAWHGNLVIFASYRTLGFYDKVR